MTPEADQEQGTWRLSSDVDLPSHLTDGRLEPLLDSEVAALLNALEATRILAVDLAAALAEDADFVCHGRGHVEDLEDWATCTHPDCVSRHVLLARAKAQGILREVAR